jgi:hypothetical protein
MSTCTPSTTDSPAGAGRWRDLGGLAVVLVVAATLAATPAGAQTTSLPTPPTTLPAENPGSTAAGVVFFGVTAVMIVGALILYLRNRRPKVASPGA